jgi:transcriptional regulator with XRE-family HTH domain
MVAMVDSPAPELIREARRRVGSSQARHADLAGTSRSRLSTYESGTVDPTVGTLERLLAPAGLALVAAPRLTPEDRRSLGFGEAIAERLDNDTDGNLIARTKAVLARMRVLDDESGGHARRLFRVWEALLDLGPGACAEILRSRSQLAQQLRSASPFAGILTNAERTAVILRTRPR